MLVHAEWVVPVSRAPIRDGAVLISGHRIAAVDTLERLSTEFPAESLTLHNGCIMLPGLVNAHTHLALTALHGIVPSAPFPEWISGLVRAMRALSADDLAISAVLGAHKAMASGTTVVGEIAYGPESPAIAADTGLGGAFFWEALGIPAEELDVRLSESEYPGRPMETSGSRQHFGLTPHSPYTSGPGLLRAVHDRTVAHGDPFAIHVAESPAETELLESGGGVLADVAARTAPDFRTPATSPVRYLAELGVLTGALAVHCAEATGSDIPLLASEAAGVVLCPRSNAYVRVGPAPVEALARSGTTLALGTDSLASNQDLDLFAEARALAALAPRLSPERIVRIMTAEGASALGLGGEFGALAQGLQADLAIFRVGGGKDPYDALLDQASRRSTESVMAAGVWRVLSGQALFPSRFAESAVRQAAARAAIALQ